MALVEDEVVQRVRKIIETDMHEPAFSIERLCREVHLSRSQLHRKIKRETGLSTSLYIRKVRLERAAQLLRETNDHISEIAYQTGIDSPQNFSKYFALEYGMAPSLYRKSFLEAENLEEAKELSKSTVQTSFLSSTVIYIILIISVILGLFFVMLYK